MHSHYYTDDDDCDCDDDSDDDMNEDSEDMDDDSEDVVSGSNTTVILRLKRQRNPVMKRVRDPIMKRQRNREAVRLVRHRIVKLERDPVMKLERYNPVMTRCVDACILNNIFSMIYLFLSKTTSILCLLHARLCVPQHKPQHLFVHCVAARFSKHVMQEVSLVVAFRFLPWVSEPRDFCSQSRKALRFRASTSRL